MKSEILAKNYSAIKSLSCGDYKNAVTAFRSTLQNLLDQVGSVDESLEGADILFEPVSCEPVNSSSILDCNSFLFYNKVFLIHEAEDRLSSARQQNQVSVAILYNMGLAFHLLATKSTVNQHSNLTKALKLYEMALEANTKNDASEIENTFFLAIFNNMGNIYSHFMDEGRIQYCLEGMAYYLHCFCGPSEVVLDECLSHFQMNVALLYGSKIGVAPAA